MTRRPPQVDWAHVDRALPHLFSRPVTYQSPVSLSDVSPLAVSARARSQGLLARAGAPGRWPLALALGALFAAGCDHTDASQEPTPADRIDPLTLVPKEHPVPDWARDEIAQLVEALKPLDPTLTSNHHDQQYWREKALIERLERSEPEVGWAALHAFTNSKDRDYKVRRNLLRVGARSAPEEAKPLLEALAFTYGFNIEDRTEALLLFAEVSPARYMELARPFVVRRGVLRQTLPNDEFLVKGWAKACEVSGVSPVPEMADVATNLMVESYARVFALRTLGRHDLTPESRSALQTCLIESMGDGFIRRVAAQEILRSFPREDSCALMREVLSREADPAMATFLDALLQENCR